MTEQQAQSVEIWALSLAGIAVVFALDALTRLRKLKAGEVEEKIAMIYGHAATVCSTDWASAEARNFYTARIVSDVKAMDSMGKLGEKEIARIQNASDGLLCAMVKRGYYTTDLANALADILFD